MAQPLVHSRRPLVALALLALTADAAAQGYGYGGPSPTADAWPLEVAARPRTLARGMFEFATPVAVDVSLGATGNPASVPLALRAGLTDWLALGVGYARGLCLTAANGSCAAAYDDFRVEGFARFYAAGPLSAAYGVALAATTLRDVTALSAEAMLEVRLSYDRFAVALDPVYGFGLNRRGSASRIADATFPLTSALAFGTSALVENRETVHVPLTATVQVLSRAALAAGIALDGVVDPLVGRFADAYRVPVGFAAVITPARMVDFGAAFTFTDLLGRSDGARPRSDARVVQAFIALRTGGGGATPAPAVLAPAAAAPARGTSAVPVMAHEAAAAQPIPAAAAPATGAAAVAQAAVAQAAPAPYTISIENFAFVPPSLDVPPGATVTVRNGDPAPHSVTSASAPGEFAPGGVAGVAFDTGPFTGERSFTIPADAPPGTVVPFYCSVHRERMATPNGALRVVAPR